MARPFGRREHQPISHLDSPAFAAGDPVLGGHTMPPGHATTRFVPCLDLELAVLQSSVHTLPLDVKERARQRFDVRITPSNTCVSADGISFPAFPCAGHLGAQVVPVLCGPPPCVAITVRAKILVPAAVVGSVEAHAVLAEQVLVAQQF